jgi:hypothetical protein
LSKYCWVSSVLMTMDFIHDDALRKKGDLAI